MLRFKMIVLSMFAVLAVAAWISAASASADSCITGTKSVFCTFPGNVPIHSGEVLGTSGLSLLTSKIGGAKVKIDCVDDTFKAELELLGKGKGVIEFLNCSVIEPTGCTVSQPIKATFSAQLSSGVMPATALFQGNGTGGENEEFTKITIGVCSVAGTFPITGLQKVQLPGAESGALEHEVVAEKSESELKLGVEGASFSSKAKVHLATGGEFLIMLGT